MRNRKVIYIRDYMKRSVENRLNTPCDTSDGLDRFCLDQTKFNREHESLLKSFQTRRSVFMFPTILCRYRRNINPVNALYHSLQDTLFNYDEDNSTHQWIVSLFKNKKWLSLLITCIKKDIQKIDAFISKHTKMLSGYSSSIIQSLRNIKKDFLHYAEAFILMDSWNKSIVY